MKWILIISIIIIAWCVVDFHLGKRLHRKKLRKREYPLRNGELTFITTGKDLFNMFFSDIQHAASTIHILFFIVKNDKISMEFMTLLQKKAKEGVQVRLLLDWAGSRFHVSRKTLQQLKAAGVEIEFSHQPSFPFYFFSLQQRNHRKITVIDGKIGYTGGYNIGKEYINLDPVLSPWRDYHLRITGESVGDLQQEFLIDWERIHHIDGKIHSISPSPSLTAHHVQHRFFPSEGQYLEEEFGDLIDGAKQSIEIGTPYFVPTKILFEKLLAAVRRGIAVTILIPNKSDHSLVKEASFRYLRPLLREGATVYQYMNGFFHAKVMIIDRNMCDIGTANFDRRSIALNHEVNCFIYDQAFTDQVASVFQKDILHSELLTLRDLQQTTWITKIKELTAWMIQDYL
ncbi:cardiolipin synthase [Bacillus chungangensis]|uniref:Cardiolipin synthase n=1 Tax=Bacillus chungangensis TaxID=587633 RepID=A0ABT9WW45_9BACI|nr:cardiolipin synthase [Bacillus chungangensis]MDQ0177517.1 cardiolipin synthase [Bacillus chungangensis]